MIREMTHRRFHFTCSGCGHGWGVDYDVQHVDDGHGTAWDCYFEDGQSAAAPTAPGVVCCPQCGASLVRMAWTDVSPPAPTRSSSAAPGDVRL